MHRVFASTLALLLSCRPDLGERESLVTRTRVLAVRGEPPEAKPGANVSYTLLVAGPSGPIRTPAADWAFCATPKLLVENGAASAACLFEAAVPVASGRAHIETALPSDACGVFGPDVGSAELRPRDPDITGGYYQPLRVSVFDGQGATVAFGLERLTCNLANASADVVTDFARRYVANRNPEIVSLVATLEGTPVSLDGIPRGARVTLRATWSETSAETYVVYDLQTRSLVSRREVLRLSWFATAGGFDTDRTGQGEQERETFSENAWTAPDEATTVHLFIVLRDARGGVAFASYAAQIR